MPRDFDPKEYDKKNGFAKGKPIIPSERKWGANNF